MREWARRSNPKRPGGAMPRPALIVVDVQERLFAAMDPERLLTALDLIAAGFSVSIVADAVCSRRRENLDLGLAQARQAGGVVTSTGTLVFHWLGRFDTGAFPGIGKPFQKMTRS